MGYKLTYYLIDFTYYSRGRSSYYGDIKFEQLQPKDEKEAENWLKHREEAYYGSLRHFFKSLIDNKLKDQNFLAFELNENTFEKSQGKLRPRLGNALIPLSPLKSVTFASNIFDKRIVFSKPVEIIYQGEIDHLSPYKDAAHPVTQIRTSGSFVVNSNGCLLNPLSVSLSGSLVREGVADLLPYDYLPETLGEANLYAQLKDDKVMGKLVSQYESAAEEFPYEKVYLHLDKPMYAAGDDIWFNVYLTYYNSKKLIQGLTKIYVDLILPDDSIFKTLILPVVDGMAPGNFTVPDSLPSGSYSIRAYTAGIIPFGEAYFFKKSIDIFNTSDTTIFSKAEDLPISLTADNIALQFFPEGGNMVYGTEGKVAYKATDLAEKGITVKGEIQNNKNKVVANFKSNSMGLGSFIFTPKEGETYSARTFVGDNFQVFPLPTIASEGFTLTADNTDEDILKLSVRFSDASDKETFYIVGQSREIIFYKTKGKLHKGIADIEIPKVKLPKGVFQVTLFNAEGIPVRERLVYIDHDQGDIETLVKPDKLHYAKREKVSIKVSIADAENGVPIEGNTSLAVVDADIFNSDLNRESILTHTFLGSDLRGKIENPGYYFKDQSPKVLQDLDLLMLTHGWKRFTWNQIIDPDFSAPISVDSSKELTVRGTVYLGKKPLKQAQLLVIPPNSAFMVVRADDEGKFSIPYVQLYDTSSVIINTTDAKGRNINTSIAFDPFVPPPIASSLDYNLKQINPAKFDNFFKKAAMRNKIENMYDFEGRTVLGEVQVRGNKNPMQETRDISIIHGKPEVMIENVGERFSMYNNILEAVKSRVTMRGPGSFGTSETGEAPEPLYLLDGIPIPKTALENIHPKDVDRIEVIKEGAGASIYGVRAMHGVVAVYSKTGKNASIANTKGINTYKLPAYSVSREFYSPKYNLDKDENSKPDIRTTLFRSPNITFNESGEAEVHFYNSDNTSRFQIIVEGLSINGDPFVKIWTAEMEQ